MNIVDYINNLNKDKASSFVGATSSDILIKKNIDAKVSDTSWIDMVEECIPYLDNIIRNPRRFIVQEENIVPIEKAKVVTEESIRHLAQHTSMIQEVQEDGTVIPLKLLNVYREETVDLYENRFIKSLVDNLYTFVTNKLEESDQKSYAKVDSEVTYKGIMKKKDEVVEVNLQLTSKKETDVDASKDGHSLDERIEHIRDIVSAFRSSRLRPCSLAVLSTQRFRESMAKEIASSFLLIKAKSLISSSLILPSRAIWISRPVRGLISFRPAMVSRMIFDKSVTSTSGT